MKSNYFDRNLHLKIHSPLGVNVAKSVPPSSPKLKSNDSPSCDQDPNFKWQILNTIFKYGIISMYIVQTRRSYILERQY